MIATTILSSLLLAGEAMPSYTVEVDAIVLRGDARTQAQAEEVLKLWTGTSLEAAATRYLHLPEGYPKIVRSDDIRGMRPGFRAVLLGYCEPGAERDRIVDVLTTLDPNIYVRRVRLPKAEASLEQCPALDERLTRSEPTLTRFRVAGAGNTVVVTLLQDAIVIGVAVISLRTPAGREVDGRYIGVDDHCHPTAVEQPDRARLVVKGECDRDCTAREASWSVGVAGDSLVMEETAGPVLGNTDSCHDMDE